MVQESVPRVSPPPLPRASMWAAVWCCFLCAQAKVGLGLELEKGYVNQRFRSGSVCEPKAFAAWVPCAVELCSILTPGGGGLVGHVLAMHQWKSQKGMACTYESFGSPRILICRQPRPGRFKLFESVSCFFCIVAFFDEVTRRSRKTVAHISLPRPRARS